MNFYDLTDKYEDRPIVIDDNGVQLNKELHNEIETKIRNLIQPRRLVFFIGDNSAISISIYISLLNHAIVPVMISRDLNVDLFEQLAELYKPEYIILKKENVSLRLDTDAFIEIGDYICQKTKYTVRHKLYDELALLLTTSGSTGSPKLVRQSYKNINSNAQSIAKYLEITKEERPITSLPIHYTYGISVINSHLLLGATILATNQSVVQRGFWEFFKEYGATSIAGVPYTYMMLKRVHFFQMDLPSLTVMTQAGGKLAVELHEDFAKYAANSGKKFIVMYGQTEATARMAYLPYEKALEKIGSMGIAIPNGRFELIDESGNKIDSPDTIGELVYYGENVTLGYSKQMEDLGKGDERKGILVTGDMAKFDKDGYYYIVGRKKRFLKVYGNRVNIDEIERMLDIRFKENEFACTGEDDHISVYYTGDIIEKEVFRFFMEVTGINKQAVTLYRRREIPKNEAGKILYSQLSIE